MEKKESEVEKRKRRTRKVGIQQRDGKGENRREERRGEKRREEKD